MQIRRFIARDPKVIAGDSLKQKSHLVRSETKLLVLALCADGQFLTAPDSIPTASAARVV